MELTDGEIMDAMPRQLHEDLTEVCRLASDSIGVKVGGMLRVCLNRGIVDHCRAAIAADRAANTPLPSSDRERWPETFSRRQRAEDATRLCTEAGIDLKSPGARRLVRDAEDGMPLHDVLDLIKHWNTTATTSPSGNETR